MKKLFLFASVIFCLKASAANITITAASSMTQTGMGAMVTGNQDTMFLPNGNNFTASSSITGIHGTAAHHITIMPAHTGAAFLRTIFSGGLHMSDLLYIDIIDCRFTTSSYGLYFDGNGSNSGGLSKVIHVTVKNCDGINLTSGFVKNFNSIQCSWSKTDSTQYASWDLKLDSIYLTTCGQILVGSFSTAAAAKDVALYDTIRNIILNDPTVNEQISYMCFEAYVGHIKRYQVTTLHYTGDVGLVNAGGTGRGFSGTIEDIECYGPWSGWIARINAYKLWKNYLDATTVINNFKEGSTSFGSIYMGGNSSDLKTDTISAGRIIVNNNGLVNAPTENSFYNNVLFLGAVIDSVTFKNNWSANCSFAHGTGTVPASTFSCNSCSTTFFDTAKDWYFTSATAAMADSVTGGAFPMFKPLFGSPLIGAGVSTPLTGVGKKDLAGLICVNNNIGPWEYVPSGYLGYTVPNDSYTAGGVFSSAGKLIRQIWASRHETPGVKSVWWDGFDQFGNVSPYDTYSAKAESYNIGYNWDGEMGNSETNQTGNNSLSALWGVGNVGYDAVVVGSNLYTALGYSEGNPVVMKSPTSDINTRTSYIGLIYDITDEHICSDGTNIYLGGYDPNDAAGDSSHSFVYAYVVSGETLYSFSSGTNYTPHLGPSALSCAGLKTTGGVSNNRIWGLAVQQSHNFLFVCRKALNEVQVINKNTGVVAQTITTITSPTRCAVDPITDNVWIADGTSVKEYTVNTSTGALTATGNAISITSDNVVGMRVSPNGKAVTICDANNLNVHSYRTSDAGSIWTLGTGDYRTNAAVTNYKFFWQDAQQKYPSFVCYFPDSTFMIGDRMDNRILKYANDHATFSTAQYYMNKPYYLWMDAKNPQHLFASFMQYNIDNTQSIGSSWTLAYNWGGVITSTYDRQQQIITPCTMSNGRTYGFVRTNSSGAWNIVELVSGGVMRFTGNTLSTGSGQSYFIDSLSRLNICSRGDGTIGTNVTYSIDTLTSFDGSNNPIWGGTPKYTMTVPATTATDTRAGYMVTQNCITNLNHWIFFDIKPSDGTVGKGWHIGAMALNGSSYLYQQHPSNLNTYKGPFPGQGQSPELPFYFESGNGENSAGSGVSVYGRFYIVNHHGEFWKQWQTNFYTLFDDTTQLCLGNFGKTRYEYQKNNSGIQYGIPGSEGNVLSFVFTKGNDGNYHLYHGGEGIHNGIHQWTISGLSGINILSTTFTPNPASPAVTGVDLMAGFVAGTTNPANGTSGWVRNTPDYSDASGHTTTYVGLKSYDRSKSPDLYIDNQISGSNHDVSFTRSLIPDATRSFAWQLSFDVNWDNNELNPHDTPPTYNNGSFVDLLDSTGKAICEIHLATNFSGTDYVVMNGADAFSSNTGDSVFRLKVRDNRVTWTYAAGTLFMTYAGVSKTVVTPFITGADMTQPYTMRLHVYVNTGGGPTSVGKSIDIQNATFIQAYSPPPATGCPGCIPNLKYTKKR